jgi:hypothetical protein
MEPETGRLNGGRPRLLIVPEISLRGDAILTRVLDDRGDPVLIERATTDSHRKF